MIMKLGQFSNITLFFLTLKNKLQTYNKDTAVYSKSMFWLPQKTSPKAK